MLCNIKWASAALTLATLIMQYLTEKLLEAKKKNRKSEYRNSNFELQYSDLITIHLRKRNYFLTLRTQLVNSKVQLIPNL